jgi:hypothetical protein
MAEQNIAELRGIQNSWSLMAFARAKGLPHPNTSKNTLTGETFHNLCFVDQDNNRTFVAFSSKLGELTPEEIVARKDELQVVKLNPDADGKEGGYLLCKAGNLNLGEAIQLF